MSYNQCNCGCGGTRNNRCSGNVYQRPNRCNQRVSNQRRGCNNNNISNSGSRRSDHCVIATVHRIINAQQQAVDQAVNGCATSCNRSIDSLLSPFESTRRRPSYNTIPFILYSKHTAKPFVASGVINNHRKRRNNFRCIESPIFRVINTSNRNGNCVQLELLTPVSDHHHNDNHSQHGHHHHHHHDQGKNCCPSVCSHFPDQDIHNFYATGICITVDLNNFCAISCLDPINPVQHGQCY